MKGIWYLLKPFYTGKEKIYARYMGLFLMVLSLSSIAMSYFFLEWYGDFYNALEAKDYAAFKYQLWKFVVLAGIGTVLYTFTRYWNMTYALRWRRFLTFYLLPKWSKDIEGSSQRIQEDCLKFAKMAESLFLGVLNSVGTLVVFSPILWELNKAVYPEFDGLLWIIAAGYSFFGLTFSFIIGRKLPLLEYNNQKAEAAFRTSLELQLGNEPRLFDIVKDNYMRLFNQYKIFNFWTGVFFRVSMLLPYFLVGHLFFEGIITLGILIQVAKSFDKIQGSMSYLIDNWTTITELQSVIKRLVEFKGLPKK